MVADPWSSFVSIAQPGYLAVLAVVPLVVALSLRSLAGLGPVRRPLAVGLRCLVIAVMACALAGPEWVRQTDDQTVIFALDQSGSVPAAQQREALAFVEQAAVEMRAGKDRIAVLSFAARPSVDQLPNQELIAGNVGVSGDRHQTDIAAALRLGLALFPGDTARRLVMISDGNERRGMAAAEADAFAALGVPIDVVPLRYEHAAEVLIDQLSAPAAANLDEVITLRLVVRSQVDTTARLLLYHNDRLVRLDPATPGVGMPIELEAGANRFTIPVELRAPGVHRFRAVVEPDDPAADSIAVNNEGRAFTIVGEATRVVVIAASPTELRAADWSSAEILANALRQGGVQCDLIPFEDLPSDPGALADASAVILSNVSALDLGTARQELLASYVRDQGGGLLVIGGDYAFSMGGYDRTPLEEVLPVETSRDKLKLLSLAMVIVIDRSGSMAGEKIAMARQAAIGAAERLSRLDRVGVIAFDSAAEWIVPLQPAENRTWIAQRIATIGAGGGTDLYPALEQSQQALLGAGTNLRHIIALTDGRSAPGAFESLAESCGQAGITISTIAVGPDADRPLLARVAQRSGGRLYIADSASPLPQIFARETALVSRAALFEQPFTPRLDRTIDERILRGFAPAEIPPLYGHVVTAAKPAARTPLVRPTADGADPILAYWQVGLGRAVAFTSGLWPKWGPEWAAWPGFSKLWTQAVRYAARPGHPGELQVEASVRGGDAIVSVSAEHLPLRAQSSLVVVGHVTTPDFSRSPLDLRRTAAGRYEAAFPLDAPGTYLVNLPYSYGVGEQSQSGVLSTGVVQSYSSEYRTLGHNEAVLAELARRTGGRVLDMDDAGTVYEPRSIRPIQTRRPFWEDLIRLALVLFILDVAVRRMAVGPAEAVDRLRRFIHELAGTRSGADSLGTLGALRGAKQRAQGEVSSARPPQPPGPVRAESEPAEALSRARDGVDADEPAVPAPPRQPGRPETSESDYMSRLLRAKRSARRRDDPGEEC
jgi:uncharacterized membrane protein